jgi:hypothetical protein
MGRKDTPKIVIIARKAMRASAVTAIAPVIEIASDETAAAIDAAIETTTKMKK